MIYSGIDLHKNFSFITTVNQQGEVLNQVKIRNDELAILKYFASFQEPHRAVVECTMNWYWIADLLNNHGFPCLVAHARYLKAISYARVKTDKVDSLTIAQLLRMDYIPASHQVPEHLRSLRDLMRQRLCLINKRTSHLLSIHMTLGKYNRKLPSTYPLNHPENFRFIQTLDLPAPAQLHPTPEIQLLLCIPGIGDISSMTIWLETGNIKRFPDDPALRDVLLSPGARSSLKGNYILSPDQRFLSSQAEEN